MTTTDEFVNEQIDLQMGDVISPEVHLKSYVGGEAFDPKRRSSPDDVKDATKSLELKGGPADVTAFHDFYDLQIAFEPIWMELFDGDLEKFGQRLYAETVQLEVFPVVEKVESIIDLESYLFDSGELTEQVFIAEEPDRRVLALVFITPEQWGSIDLPNRQRLIELAELAAAYQGYIESCENKLAENPGPVWEGIFRKTINYFEGKLSECRDEAQQIVDLVPKRASVDETTNRLQKLKKMIRELSQRLSERYKFDIFAPNSVNFGVLVTYRQQWDPLNYQVGELVSTIPLAPKEVRKFTKKRVVKSSRAEKEIEESLRIRKQESANTSRDTTEIVRKATKKSNFKQTADESFLGFVSGTTAVDVEASDHSEEVKKGFRESVLKAAEEYKQDHKLEISTQESVEFEETTSGEISNPNDELPVTYLFYELQRRYDITETIHRLTPVVLVANEVPAPNDIDEDWLIAHDWILRRAILDDSFLPALDFLAKSLAGTEFSLDVLWENMDQQADVVKEIKQQIAVKSQALSLATQRLEAAIERRAQAAEEEESEGIFEEFGESLFGEPGNESAEATRLRQEAAQAAFERTEREVRELRSRLGSELTSLQVATDKYVEAVTDHLNRQVEIARLRIHVKDNILYYMQAIWDHEPPDQRFFRLYNLDVLDIAPLSGLGLVDAELRCTIRRGPDGRVEHVCEVVPVPRTIPIEKKKLIEVADLDNLLGYKGNYMIFPLKQSNFITTYMLLPYVDLVMNMGLRDPDDPANFTTDELMKHIKSVYETDPETFNEMKETYREQLKTSLTALRREKDTIVVPTDSLYIEALPGSHPLLEDFKLLHRAMDVKKVQAETRHAELENIRLAARLMEKKLEDPDIEKRVIVSGNGVTATVETDGD